MRGAARSRRPLDHLIVAEDEDMLSVLAGILAPHVRYRLARNADEALAAVRSEPLAGLIADGALAGRRALELARSFLGHQATGRVAIIGSTADQTTLIGLLLRDRRIEVVYQPIDEAALLDAVLSPHGGWGRAATVAT
jgi:DNA-binding NtrC family response regulator